MTKVVISKQNLKISVSFLYICHQASSNKRRQLAKYRCMYYMMKKIKTTFRDYIIAGDWNIAHKNVDIHNWKRNLKNAEFLPEERAWIDTLFNKSGFIDAFRELDQEKN